MKSIIGIGNALTDILAVVEDDSLLKKYNLPKGSMNWVDSETASTIWNEIKGKKVQIVPGGSAANTISSASILGMKSAFIGKVGKGSHTYLLSPMAAMATAIRGCITDPRDILG